MLELAAPSTASCVTDLRRADRGAAGASCASTTCENIFPLVTPQATDPAHPFPFISNLSLNLLVTLRYPKDPSAVAGPGQGAGRAVDARVS